MEVWPSTALREDEDNGYIGCHLSFKEVRH